MHILLVDDDAALMNILAERLIQQRYVVDIAADGHKGRKQVCQSRGPRRPPADPRADSNHPIALGLSNHNVRKSRSASRYASSGTAGSTVDGRFAANTSGLEICRGLRADER